MFVNARKIHEKFLVWLYKRKKQERIFKISIQFEEQIPISVNPNVNTKMRSSLTKPEHNGLLKSLT